MSACPSCNSLYSHAPNCRTVRPTVEVPYHPTVVEQAMMSAEMEAREINELMTGRPILDMETIENMVAEGVALREAIEKRLDPMLSGNPCCVPEAGSNLDELEARAIKALEWVHSQARGDYVPTMDLAMPLPDGYWWCDECSASREKGHSCYERKSW